MGSVEPSLIVSQTDILGLGMAKRVVRFSCMVDQDPMFLEQSLRWARSLLDMAGVSAEDIVVHHTGEVALRDLAALHALNVATCLVDAVSRRRPHLNKLDQLGSKFLQDADVAVLCDCDTVFVADPRPYLPFDAVAAGVVDLPNPPIEIWDTLLQRAGLVRQRPDIAVGSARATTIFENRNGGLYVFPGKRLRELDAPWRRWADWLEAHTDVLGRYAMFIDQISFALTCLELRIEPELLPRALNFPTHLPAEGSDDGAPIMLHYHNAVDPRGDLKSRGLPTVDRAIRFANERLARPAKIVRKRRLMLHVGMPKTGSSALQQWCHAHSDRLLDQSIRYPQPSNGTEMPKHQFVVENLLSGDFSQTAAALSEGGEETIILTTEGLTNHLYDFRPSSLAKLRTALEPFNVTVFMVHRKTDDWLKSYHKQCEINPNLAQYAYGLGLELSQFRRVPRVAKLANVNALVEDCVAYGAAETIAETYESDWARRFLEVCGYVAEAPIEFQRTNEIVPDWVFDAVLRINRSGFSPDGPDGLARNVAAVHADEPQRSDQIRTQRRAAKVVAADGSSARR